MLTQEILDSLTQVLLGAAVGEAVAGRKVGNKAVIWGAVAGTIPDLDVLAESFMDTVDALAFHRGLTHSLVFAMVMAPILGYVVHKIHRGSAAIYRDWTLLMFLGLFTHPLLDCFTTWGTELFWPFSDYRVAFKSIFVIDPLYTVPLLICVVLLMFLKKDSRMRSALVYTGLAISTGYLLFTLVAKAQADLIFEASFDQHAIDAIRYDSRPAPFNTILWTCNVETQEGYHVGYKSFFDADRQVEYNYFPKNEALVKPYLEDDKVGKLLEITEGWYTAEPADPGIIINDLRFGQLAGWEKDGGKFVFSYHIYQQDGSVQIDEVEKDFREGRKMLQPLWTRVMGKD